MRTRREARDSAREDKLAEWEIDVPNDPLNEQIVLASMTLDEKLRERLARQLRPEVFFADKHRAIFVGFQELVQRGLDYDPGTLARIVPGADVRLLEQLEVARSEVPTNIEFHVDTLLWDSQRAQFARGPLAAIVAAIQDPKTTPDRIRAICRQVGGSFAGESTRAPHLRDPKQVVSEMMIALEKRIAGEAHYPFGIDGLDTNDAGERRTRPGAAPGGVTTITAVSGGGKTTLAARVVLGLARQRRRVLVGAWEVLAPMTLELMTTMSLGWSRTRVLDGKTNTTRDDVAMTEEELDLFRHTARSISKWVVFLENPFRRGSSTSKGRVSNDDYLDTIEQHVEASGCDVALFDLFDRCLRNRRPDDEQEALWRLVEMTSTHQIHSILVHQQLIKGEEVRKDHRPSLAGMKGSSAYVDASWLVLAPHLPARFKNVPNDKMELFGLKQRYGDPFAVEFDWSPEKGEISGGRDMGLNEAMWDPEVDEQRGGGRSGIKVKTRKPRE